MVADGVQLSQDSFACDGVYHVTAQGIEVYKVFLLNEKGKEEHQDDLLVG